MESAQARSDDKQSPSSSTSVTQEKPEDQPNPKTAQQPLASIPIIDTLKQQQPLISKQDIDVATDFINRYTPSWVALETAKAYIVSGAKSVLNYMGITKSDPVSEAMPAKRTQISQSIFTRFASISSPNDVIDIIEKLGVEALKAWYKAKFFDSNFFVTMHATRNFFVVLSKNNPILSAARDEKIAALYKKKNECDAKFSLNQKNKQNTDESLIEIENIIRSLTYLEDEDAFVLANKSHLYDKFLKPVSGQKGPDGIELNQNWPSCFQEAFFLSHYNETIRPITSVSFHEYSIELSGKYFLANQTDAVNKQSLDQQRTSSDSLSPTSSGRTSKFGIVGTYSAGNTLGNNNNNNNSNTNNTPTGPGGAI